MAINMKRYIDIGTTVVNELTGSRDFSALVFTKDAMKSSVTSSDANKVAYEAGNVISLAKDEVGTYFADSTDIFKFATKYFGYTSLTGRSPNRINIAFVDTDETANVRFNEVVESFVNFGTVTFIGSGFTIGTAGSNGLLDVASSNQNFGMQYLFVVPVKDSDIGSDGHTLFHDIHGTHIVLENDSDAYPAWRACAWAASLNYDDINASSTLMFKKFGNTDGAVKTDALADKYDKARINYVGLVQTRADTVQFYQTGVNADGLDAGVYIDSAWIQSRIDEGWFALATGTNKIPANGTGLAIVRAMILGVAERALENGCILADKPLTNEQIALVNQYAGNTAAADAVQTTGYYIAAMIELIDGKYTIKYTLVYSKGDHISKVVGTHVLV